MLSQAMITTSPTLARICCASHSKTIVTLPSTTGNGICVWVMVKLPSNAACRAPSAASDSDRAVLLSVPQNALPEPVIPVSSISTRRLFHAS